MTSILQEKEITTSFIMSPSELDHNWQKNLHAGVSKSLTGKCTFEHGYITNIKRILKILDQQVTRTNGHVQLSLKVLADVLKPQVGDNVDVVVEMIFPHGVFCYHRMVRMMLPLSKCSDFMLKQDFSMSFLSHKTKNIVIRKNETIPVIIDDVRFENNLYTCIVSLDVNKLKEKKVK